MICASPVDEECQLVADALAYYKPVWKMKIRCDILPVQDTILHPGSVILVG